MDVTHAALLFIAVWLLGLTLKTYSLNAASRDAARQHDFQEMAKQMTALSARLDERSQRDVARQHDFQEMAKQMTDLSALSARLDERSQAIQLQLAGIQEYLQRDRK